MANLSEQESWIDGIYQLEVSDRVAAGPGGISNRQAEQLASRTTYLKKMQETTGDSLQKHLAASDPHSQYAPKNSPALTGTPTAPTAASGSNDTQLATTAFVKAAVAALVNGSPAALDTLQELANALGNDPNFSTTILNALAGKLAKDQNGADISDKSKFRENVGLVKQTAPFDATTGTVMVNGAWGLGGSGIMADDANEIIQSGQCKFFRSSASKDVNMNWPDSGGYAWRGINVAWDTNASSILAFNQSNGTSPTQPRMYYRTRAGGMNSPWLNVLMSNQYTIDVNGYFKTPTSAAITPTSIGAMSINDLAGIPLPFPGAVAPAGWLKCNGQQFDTAQFPVLASRYPSGFLPDLRGEFVRGWDDGRGADAGRALLSAQGDAIRNITGNFNPGGNGVGADQKLFTSGPYWQASNSGAASDSGLITFDASKVVPTANENRPRNIAFNYIVRAA
ncbi:hypothetical protein QT13_04240 [Pectobacterium brasiliense]|uniref:phage tail protein n=1 Tax=Pectobacterium brasiliense TaxID=180957 RepID=UPI0005802F55|nr:phage tail protein [Pectobacterium brasiliense]KHS73817.1 hypothetical protein QT13_04240 [Pectobacterium brasiliense]KHS87626.1 hypothetical protein RC83_09740 [Pectobacterium brasiliense]